MVTSAKELLMKQAAEAFRGRADMPLMAALDGISQEEASWQMDVSTPSIEQIVRHIAWSKSRFCQRGFGTPMVLEDESVNGDGDLADLPWEFPCGAGWGRKQKPGVGGAIELLEKSQEVFMQCLSGCSEQKLAEAIPTQHGKTAMNFFWTMLTHDLYHAGQIRTRRTMFRVRGESLRKSAG